MAELPSASVTIDDEAGAFAGGTGYAIVFGVVEKNADLTPRVFASTKGLLDQHGYSPAADYIALHIEKTKKPVIFVGLPNATNGTVGRQNNSGVTGTSVISIASGSAGYLEETDCILTVTKGGTVGTDQIMLSFSADGGRTTKSVRLGTANSYTVPYLGIIISFAAGTLAAGDTYTFTTTPAMWDSAGLTAARTALARQQKLGRSFVIIGDLPNSTFAGYVTTETNAYETTNKRFVYARAQVRDRLPLAAMSKLTKRMLGAPTLTFAAAGHTITRSAGSFITDGFAVGDVVTVAGSASNNVTGAITVLTATVMTLGATTLVDEGPVSNCTLTGSDGLVFDGTAHTITRSAGSWLDDGFSVGDSVTIAGTASNNSTHTITVLTATVMTFASGLVNETIGAANATITTGETMAAWVSAMDAAFATVDSQKRIDLGLGRLRKQSPITGWLFRRPVAWAASIREYQTDLDVQIPTWRKADGPLDNWLITDEDGNVIEFDEANDGGGLAARFTCARTWENGPEGAFIALSLTRAPDGSLLSRTHNMAVANLACSVTQAESENAVGQVLVLKDDGTGTDDSLQKIEERVNSALQTNLLQARAPTNLPRASKAVWRANKSAVLNVPGAQLPGVLDLELNGTLEQIATLTRIQTAGG